MISKVLIFTATVIPEDATTQGPFYINITKEDFDRNDIIIGKIQSARPGSGGYIKENVAKCAWLSTFFDNEITKYEERMESMEQEQRNRKQPAIVYGTGGYIYFTSGEAMQTRYIVGRNCSIPLSESADDVLALYTGNLNSDNSKDYILPDWKVSFSNNFDISGFLKSVKVVFQEGFYPFVALCGNTLLSVQKEALYRHESVKEIKVGAVHLVGPSSAHKSTLYNHFRWTLPQDEHGPIRIDKMSVAALRVETGRWCRFPVGQDPCEDQPGKLAELFTLLDRIYEGSNEIMFQDLGKDKKMSVPSNIHLVWQGEMAHLFHMDISRLSKDLFLFMEEVKDNVEDADEMLDRLKATYCKDASSLFRLYVQPVNVSDLWNKTKVTKKKFADILVEEHGKIVYKHNRLLEGYALNFEASLEFLQRAGIEIDKNAFQNYFVHKCIPIILNKICSIENKDFPTAKEFKAEHLIKCISNIGDEKVLQHITFVTGQDKSSQSIAFSAKYFKDVRLKQVFPSSQVTLRCRFVSPTNPSSKVWFMHRKNKDMYGSKSCQSKGYVVSEDECPPEILQAFALCLKKIPGLEVGLSLKEMREKLDEFFVKNNQIDHDTDHDNDSNELSSCKEQFLSLSNEEKRSFLSWVSADAEIEMVSQSTPIEEIENSSTNEG